MSPETVHLELGVDFHHCSQASPSSFASPETSIFTGSAARTTPISRTQSSVRFASLPRDEKQNPVSKCPAQSQHVREPRQASGRYSRMHTPPLNHDVPGARNRLLHLVIRSLAVDDVKGRRGCHNRELAAEDDHVVGRGSPVLEESTPKTVSLSSLYSCAYSY